MKSKFERNNEIRRLAVQLYKNLRLKGHSHQEAILAIIDFVITACDLD